MAHIILLKNIPNIIYKLYLIYIYFFNKLYFHEVILIMIN
jgi:hypothetical protein